MEIDKKDIGKRIRDIRKKLSLNQEAFGELLGVTKSSISVYENGDGCAPLETLVTIKNLGNTTFDWLLYGRGGAEIDNIAEPQEAYTATMSVRGLAGAGNPCCIDQLESIGQITVEKGYDGPNIQVVKIRGTSMEPTIMDGGYVGIDIASKEIISGQMYAVYIPHEGTVVKRIWIGPELVKIASDNPTAPDHDMMSERINWDTFVQGRVSWVIQKYN